MKHPINEAELQAEFYHQCRLVDLHIRLEILLQVGRLDCVLFMPDKTHVFAVVECKKNERYYLHDKQAKRYMALNLPLFWLSPKVEMKLLVQQLLDLRDKSIGKTLPELALIENPLKKYRKQFPEGWKPQINLT